MRPTVFPEVLKDGSRYTVRSGHPASTDKLNRSIIVPYGMDPCDTFIRLHELGHAKWTPAVDPAVTCKKYGVSMGALQAAEDCRVHIGLLQCEAATTDATCVLDPRTPEGARMLDGLSRYWSNPTNPLGDRITSVIHALVSVAPFTPDVSCLTGVAQAAMGPAIDGILPFIRVLPKALAEQFFTTTRAVYSRHSKAVTTKTSCSHDTFYAFAYSARDARKCGEPVDRHAKMPAFEQTLKVARWLDDVLPKDGRPPRLPGELGKDLTRFQPSTTMRKADPSTRLSFGNRETGWGVLFLETAPMSPVAHLVRILSTKVPSDMGTRMRSLDRIISDGKVFERRKKVQGGTVLVDCSGSMSWDIDDLMILLNAAPAATVALYAGNTSPHTTQLGTELPSDSGILRIVGRKGHLTTPEYANLHIGANVIDGPALRWLGSQAEPRLWVSDGKVTGCGESQPASIRAEASLLCTRGKITRIDDLDAALVAFRNLRRQRKIAPICHIPDLDDD